SRCRHTSFSRDWRADVCSSDLWAAPAECGDGVEVTLVHHPALPYSLKDLAGALHVLVTSVRATGEYRHPFTHDARRIRHGSNPGILAAERRFKLGDGVPCGDGNQQRLW